MPVSYAFTAPRDEPAFDLVPAAASIGVSQRASLGRGLAFVLLLAASSLASVYVPLALDGLNGPRWIEGAASTAHHAAP